MGKEFEKMSGGKEAKHDGAGGGGRHGSGHSSKNEKPGYMSHLSEHHLSANTPHSNSGDSMSHQNLMGCVGGGYDRGV